MGNGVTTCACCETISDRLPWFLDSFKIIKRVPMRTILQTVRYKKKKDEEESERESEKEKNKDRS